jgi:hypothetical protein
MATAQSPFFRLPHEMRDAIYDLVALDADSLYYEFSLRAGELVQKMALVTSDVSTGCPPLVGEHHNSEGTFRMWQSTPQDTDCEDGLDRVCKRFTVEYSAAVERRIECLLDFGRRDDSRLADFPWAGKKWVRLESSTQKRADESVAQNVHALTIPVPIVSRLTTLYRLHAVAYFTFRFHDSEELGPREHHFIPLQHIDGTSFFRFRLPQHSLEQLNDLMDVADWKSSKNKLNERMLWFQYFKRRTNAIKE